MFGSWFDPEFPFPCTEPPTPFWRSVSLEFPSLCVKMASKSVEVFKQGAWIYRLTDHATDKCVAIGENCGVVCVARAIPPNNNLQLWCTLAHSGAFSWTAYVVQQLDFDEQKSIGRNPTRPNSNKKSEPDTTREWSQPLV